MVFKDFKAIDIYKRLRCRELVQSIDSYPEDELDGRSDLQFLADEISYFRSCYEEDGHLLCNALLDAKELLHETRNGRRIPLQTKTLQPIHGYEPHNISSAKAVVSAYEQLRRYEKKLAAMGYYGSW